jgi:ribosome maturation factor RimP
VGLAQGLTENLVLLPAYRYIRAYKTIRRIRGVAFAGRLFSFLSDDSPQHEGLEARIAAAITPTLGQMGYELVRVQIQGKERPTVQVMADRADGSLIDVKDCEAISHAVGAVLDVDDPFPGVWNLEVSSAGIDRPLTRTKDWVRFVSQVATVEMIVPQEGRRRFRGRILSADDNEVRLKLDDGAEVTLPRSNIRRAKLVLTDELIAATAQPEPEGEAEGAPKKAPKRWRPPSERN